MLYKSLDQVSPLAVPVLVLIGRESIAGGTAEDALIAEAEALAAEAMRLA
jgi:ATP-dependent Lhr-like helicase